MTDNGFSKLTAALNEDASMIKSQSDFTSYSTDLGAWSKELEIANSNMYLFLISATTSSFELEGTAVTPTNVPIEVKTGWNWVGYPNSTEVGINDALANFSAQEGDIIKSQGGFSTYSVDAGWSGQLTTLEPGKGYLLLTSSGLTTFTYANGSKDEIVQQEKPSMTWNVNINEFPFNMTVLATVKLQDKELRSNDYEIGAFQGDVCRGTTRLMYVESKDCYLAYLTVYGNNGDNLQFRLLDHTNGDVYAASEHINYSDNAVVGQLNSPYPIVFRNLLSDEETLAGMLNIYPNPVSNNQSLMVTLPDSFAQNNLKVQIVNLMGQVVRQETMTGNTCTINGLSSGAYTVRVLNDNTVISNNKLIVK